MKNKFESFTVEAGIGCTPVTWEQAEKLGLKSCDDVRLEVKTRGLWQIPVSITGHVMEAEWTEEKYGTRNVKTKTFHGVRTAGNLQQLGYEMEGRVSLNGKKVRVFTSHVLLQLPDKKLVRLGVLFV